MFLLFIWIISIYVLNVFSHYINLISDVRDGIFYTNVTSHNPILTLWISFGKTSLFNFFLCSSSDILLLTICWSSWINNHSNSSSSVLISSGGSISLSFSKLYFRASSCISFIRFSWCSVSTWDSFSYWPLIPVHFILRSFFDCDALSLSFYMLAVACSGFISWILYTLVVFSHRFSSD